MSPYTSVRVLFFLAAFWWFYSFAISASIAFPTVQACGLFLAGLVSLGVAIAFPKGPPHED